MVKKPIFVNTTKYGFGFGAKTLVFPPKHANYVCISFMIFPIISRKTVQRTNMVKTGKEGNLEPHLRWSTDDINPPQVVLQASPGMTKGIDSVT